MGLWSHLTHMPGLKIRVHPLSLTSHNAINRVLPPQNNANNLTIPVTYTADCLKNRTQTYSFVNRQILYHTMTLISPWVETINSYLLCDSLDDILLIMGNVTRKDSKPLHEELWNSSVGNSNQPLLWHHAHNNDAHAWNPGNNKDRI